MPLQSWLLDAMEGPTPVSALIHAATMVTAGRLPDRRGATPSSRSPDAAGTAVVIVGTVDAAIRCAGSGCAKDDIKKVLAGSTMMPDRLHDAGCGHRARPATRSRSSTC